jgi:hypothetical protein
MGCGASKGAVPREHIRLDNTKSPDSDKSGETQQQPPSSKPEASIPGPAHLPGAAVHDGAKILLPGATTTGAGQDRTGTRNTPSGITPTETSLKRYQNPRMDANNKTMSNDQTRANGDTKSNALDSVRNKRRQTVNNHQMQAGLYSGEVLNGIQVCFIGLLWNITRSARLCAAIVSVPGYVSPSTFVARPHSARDSIFISTGWFW